MKQPTSYTCQVYHMIELENKNYGSMMSGHKCILNRFYVNSLYIGTLKSYVDVE